MTWLWRRCHRQDAVRAASASGRWTPALEAHASICPTCRDIRTVTTALSSPLAATPVPVDLALLWLRARNASQVAAAARASRILTTVQIAGAGLVLAVCASFLRWPDSQSAINSPDPTTLFLMGGALMTVAALWLSRWATRP
jgi:hypothetical protein